MGSTMRYPILAVTVGTALVLVSVTTLLLFVHHLATSIIADNVVARVGAQLDADILRLLPAKTAQDRHLRKRKAEGGPIFLTHGGCVQAIDYGKIVDAALRPALS